MKKINCILGFVLLIAYSGCYKMDDTPNNLDSFLISYQTISSWTDYYYIATIDQNGKLYIDEKIGLNNQSRDSEYNITGEDLSLIKEKLNPLISIKLSDKYGFDNENTPIDLPARQIKYTTKNKSDSTFIYFPAENEMPNELDSFLQVIEQIILENDTLHNQ